MIYDTRYNMYKWYGWIPVCLERCTMDPGDSKVEPEKL